MALEPGMVLLDKYRIDKLLGEGGFGHVYEATEVRLSRKVAIKELRAELATDKQMMERFINEAKAIAALNNPHILTVLSFDTEGDRYYMILEFMEGGSLANLIDKRGRLKPNEAVMIARAVCDGLAAAHSLGIVHRDIKASNILLSKDGQTVKISDFGIAHVPSGLTGAGNLTRTGVSMGTPWAMSPEQARGEKVDGRGDLYSVGVMLYQMVAGYTYLDFTSDFLGDIEKLKTQPPRPLPSDVPFGLRRIIDKALTKNPADRYQTAAEMAQALESFMPASERVYIPKGDSGRVEAPIPSPRRVPAPLLLAAGAILSIVVLALLVLTFVNLTSAPALGAVTPLLVGARATPSEAAPATPTEDPTKILLAFVATQTAAAQVGQATETAIAAKIAATLTAAAPTRTLSPTPTITPSRTPTAPPTLTPTPTVAPSSTPTREIVPIRLESPKNGESFRDESYPPLLEWRAATTGSLAANEWYRVQVYRPGQIICNLYTKRTSYALPPSGQSGDGCDPVLWRFNTGDFSWRVSFVTRVDDHRDHDTEIRNSEGWLFKWFK